jgi:hypothetical protein
MNQEENIVVQRIKDFEERFLMKFVVTLKMCQKLGIQKSRIDKIMNGTLEPTIYENIVFQRFLKVPK